MPPLLQPGDPLDEDFDAKAIRAQYVVLSNALERFRKRWHTEYLLSLREKHYNKCAENLTHHLRVGQLVMVRHDNVHRIEWPLGVITATFPDKKGVIRTAEVEECGRRTLRPVTFLVPLELDCHREDDVIRRSPSDNDERGNDYDGDDGVYNDATSTVDSNSEVDVAAGGQGGSFLPDMPSHESTYLHTSGSSRASGLANGTKRRCNLNTASPTPTSLSLPPHNSVLAQASQGEERDAGAGRGIH